MIIDVIVIGIFLLCVFLSAYRGFAKCLASLVSGAVSIVVAYLLSGKIGTFITNNTNLGALIENKISETLSYKWENSSIYKIIPDVFKDDADSIGDTLANDGAARISSLIITILSFALIVLAIKLVSLLFVSVFSAKFNEGFVGCADRLLGSAFGMLFGVFYVLLFLALLFPIASIFLPSQMEAIEASLNSSMVSKFLYDNNILLILYRDFFS